MSRTSQGVEHNWIPSPSNSEMNNSNYTRALQSCYATTIDVVVATATRQHAPANKFATAKGKKRQSFATQVAQVAHADIR